MEADVTEHLASILVVARELRTAEVVVPSMDGINALAFCLLLESLNQFFRYAIHAAYGRNYPDFISYANLTVLAHVAQEGAVFLLDVQLLIYRIVSIFQSAGKVGLEVVFVDPLTLFQVFLCMSDRVTVLDDVLSFRHIIDEHFVSGRSILQEGDRLTIYFDGFALLHRAQANHYRVGRVNFDKA